MTPAIGPAAKRVLVAIAAWHGATAVYFAVHLYLYGYLPAPFFAFVDDTFADYFHTTYWAYHQERYSEWLAVHPPVVFLIAQLISFKECFLFEGLPSRDGCGMVSLYVLLGISLLAAALNARLFSENTAVRMMCFLVIATSFPFLFAAERGNFILVGYLFVVLSASTQSRWAQGFFLACGMNIKQYLVVLSSFAFIKFRWQVLVSCGISGVLLIALSAVYLPAPDFLRFIENMVAFVDEENIGNLWRLPFSTSVDGFISFSKTADAQYFFDALVVEYPVLTTDFLFMYARTLQVSVLVMVAIVGTGLLWWRHQVSEAYISYCSLICLFNLSDASASYALVFLFAFLPTMWRELSAKEFVGLFLVLQPADAYILELGQIPDQISFLSGETVTSTLAFTVGSLARPTAMYFLLFFVTWRLLAMKLKAHSPERHAASDKVFVVNAMAGSK